MNYRNVLVPIVMILPVMLGTPDAALGQQGPQLNLQVRNAGASSCTSTNFRPEFRITNWGTAPVPINAVNIRLSFNNTRQEFIEFVGADIARIFNPNGTLTGSFGTAVAFEIPPPNPACVVAPDRRANQNHAIGLTSANPGAPALIPPNGGFATIVVQYRRAGGLNPFDTGCDDFSSLRAPIPSDQFVDDRFFGLVVPESMTFPNRLRCEFAAPNVTDPNSGIDPGVHACGVNTCPI